MEGARWDTQTGMIAESRLKELTPGMPVMFIRAIPVDKQETKNVYECPVYKTRQRGPTYVWNFFLKTKESPAKWTLAGVALLLSVWKKKSCVYLPVCFPRHSENVLLLFWCFSGVKLWLALKSCDFLILRVNFLVWDTVVSMLVCFFFTFSPSERSFFPFCRSLNFIETARFCSRNTGFNF